MNMQEEQAKFMDLMGQPRSMYPVSPESFNGTQVALWQVLIQEEHKELHTALDALDIIRDDPNTNLSVYWQLMAEVCAEAVDLIYVTLGLLNHMGLPANAMFREIHAANMRKVGPDGKPVRRADGKIIKPEGWRPADKLNVILEARDYKV